MTIIAEFQHWIDLVIPEIVNLLKDNKEFNQQSSAIILLHLSEQGALIYLFL